MRNLFIFPIFFLFILLGAGCFSSPQTPPVIPEPSGSETGDETEEIAGNIRLDLPEDGAIVSSPMTIKGSARVFEAVVSYEIRSLEEEVLATGYTMTSAEDIGLFGPFESEIFLPALPEPAFYLDVFWHSPEDGRRLDIVRRRLTVANQEKTSVNVYFLDEAAVIAGDCTAVDFEKRTVAKTARVGELAIRELLEGPTKTWAITQIPEGTTFQSLTITDGEAILNLSSPFLQDWSGGSCRVIAIRTQIEETLKQFGTVQSVRIRVNGEEEEILQP